MSRNEIMLTVNGEAVACRAGCTLLDYLAEQGLDPQKVVAEINGEILKPQAFGGRILNAGDEVEIIHFVGGG